MPAPQNQIIEKKLHTNAEILISDFSTEFTDALILQSKTLAKLEGTDEVQSIHVQKAKVIVLTLTQKKNRLRDGLFGFGCLFLGIAIQGLLAEYSATTPRLGWFLIYSVLGILSAGMIAYSYYKN